MKDLLEYYIKENNQKFNRMEKHMEDRFDKLEKKLDNLNSFKLKFAGGMTVIVVVLQVVVRAIL